MRRNIFYIDENNQHYLKCIDKNIVLDLCDGFIKTYNDTSFLKPVPRNPLSLASLSAHIQQYELLETQKILDKCCVLMDVLPCSSKDIEKR